jgi:wyosine [tRNA(Phe)-imidazoG37] synthetase (radical SAM superfamily)
MSREEDAIAYGPVPSRRLGRSLGINNIPRKSCSYSCIYCQVGPTREAELEPRRIYSPERVIAAVERRVRTTTDAGDRPDYLTFVPEGEPTLDASLGEEIRGLRPLGVPTAVLSNGSLLWREDVREALRHADWVSLKVDAADERTWRRVNRPPAALSLETVQEGLLRFAEDFEGALVTETMLVRRRNDTGEAIDAIARFLARLRPDTAYVAVPIRPPACGSMEPAGELAVDMAYQRFAARLPRVELLAESEGTAFGTSGDLAEDLLGITAVHPLRDDAIEMLSKCGGDDGSVLDRLVREGVIQEVEYQGHRFYRRHYAEV